MPNTVDPANELRLFHKKTFDQSAYKVFFENQEVKEQILDTIVGLPVPGEKEVKEAVVAIYLLEAPGAQGHPNAEHMTERSEPNDFTDEFNVFQDQIRGKVLPSQYGALFHLACAYHCLNPPPPAPIVPAPIIPALVAPAFVAAAQNPTILQSQPTVGGQVQAQVQSSALQTSLLEVDGQQTDEYQADSDDDDEDQDEMQSESQAQAQATVTSLGENSTVDDGQIDTTTVDSDEDADSIPIIHTRKTNSKANKKRTIELSPRKAAPKRRMWTGNLESVIETPEDLKNRVMAELSPELLTAIQDQGYVLDINPGIGQAAISGITPRELIDMSKGFEGMMTYFKDGTNELSSNNTLLNEIRKKFTEIKQLAESLKRESEPQDLKDQWKKRREQLIEEVVALLDGMSSTGMSNIREGFKKASSLRELFETHNAE